jgi:hypothetical protein
MSLLAKSVSDARTVRLMKRGNRYGCAHRPVVDEREAIFRYSRGGHYAPMYCVRQ